MSIGGRVVSWIDRVVVHRAQFLLVRLLRGRPVLASGFLRALRRIPSPPLRRHVFRSFAWPIAADLGARLEVPAAGGRMVVDTDDLLGRVVAVSGIWEPSITAVFSRVLRPGDVCVDVGAHVGYYTTLASKLVGELGHVYAFEPSARNLRLLRASLSRSARQNVTLYEFAAGAGEGTARLYEAPRTNTGASSMSDKALDEPAVGARGDYEPIDVLVRRIDDVVPAHAFERVRLVKVDVEGYEREALLGAEGVLSTGAPTAVIVEVNPQWASESPSLFLEEFCHRHGFSAWRVQNDYTLDGFFPERVESPFRVRAIPGERCDLVLERGLADVMAALPTGRRSV